MVIIILVPRNANRAVGDALTHHYNNAPLGAILTEILLNTASVSSGRFGKLWALYADGQVVRNPVRLRLAGRRYWQSKQILYGGGIFACRQCYQLAYASSREDAGDRASRRPDRLRVRLRWEPGILNGEGDKPKWMRCRTFERLAAKHDDLVGRSMQATKKAE
jgi:hypothetical protein